MASSRAGDPVTSHMAGADVEKSGKAAKQREACFNAVKFREGLTSAEIADRLGFDRYASARRLPELRKSGLIRNGDIRKCEIGGKLAMTWYLSENVSVVQGGLF